MQCFVENVSYEVYKIVPVAPLVEHKCYKLNP